MQQVSNKLREQVLELYNPKQRVLLDAYIDYPKIEGTFLIGPCYYANCTLEHATDIEIQLCLNQLAYLGVAEAIRQEVHPLLREKSFSKLQKECIVITESYKKFRKPIPTDRELIGNLVFGNILKSKNKSGIIFSSANFNFENDSCVGNIRFAIIDK